MLMKRKSDGMTFWIHVYIATTHLNKNLHNILHSSWCLRGSLWTLIPSRKILMTSMLMHFDKAKDLSFTHMQELHDAHQATLDAAKANILKAQKRQRNNMTSEIISQVQNSYIIWVIICISVIIIFHIGAYAVGAKILIKHYERKKGRGKTGLQMAWSMWDCKITWQGYVLTKRSRRFWEGHWKGAWHLS